MNLDSKREKKKMGVVTLLALRTASHSYIHTQKLAALLARGMKDRTSMVKRACLDLLMDSAL